MYPYIQDGDMVSLRSVSTQTIKPGDVLFARTWCNALVVHRVIRVKTQDGERLFELQGDDRKRSDGYVSERNVLGRVCSVRRGAKILKSNKPVRRAYSCLQVILIHWFGKRPVLPKIAQRLFRHLGLI